MRNETCSYARKNETCSYASKMKHAVMIAPLYHDFNRKGVYTILSTLRVTSGYRLRFTPRNITKA